MKFDAARGLVQLGELAAGMAAPADLDDACDRTLGVLAEILAPRTTLILRMCDPAGRCVPVSRGEPAGEELLRIARSAFERRRVVEELPAGEKTPVRLAMPLVAHGATLGAIGLERPAVWNEEAGAFLASAVQGLAGALAAMQFVESGRAQGALLSRRNVELEALRELAGRLHDLDTEDAMLQAALELVLRKLDLPAGWIFWGESTKGRLELAAHHGIAPEFVEQARENGVGACLCVDVFATGRLQFARNTIDCPRLPGLVCAAEVMTHACVPLKFEGGVLGVLNIANRAGQLLTAQDLQFLETVGNHLCLAVDKARTSRAQREAERLATIGTLAATLAHEIRNPLNSISLQLVLLSRRFARLATESRDELMPIVETARHEIMRLNGLVEEFLSLSSNDRIARRQTDPEGPVHEAVVLMAPTAHEHGIVLSETLAGSLPAIALDAEKLKQVLINLIRNAIEAMPDGGTLDVSTRLQESAVLFQIADSGTGIEPGLDVFDFFTTTKRGGTGLGLPIARRIVEAHGGSLTYQSAPGQGTVFTILLPWA